MELRIFILNVSINRCLSLATLSLFQGVCRLRKHQAQQLQILTTAPSTGNSSYANSPLHLQLIQGQGRHLHDVCKNFGYLTPFPCPHLVADLVQLHWIYVSTKYMVPPCFFLTLLFSHPVRTLYKYGPTVFFERAPPAHLDPGKRGRRGLRRGQ